MNTKVTHLKDQTESQTESPENGNTECHDEFLESIKLANVKHLQTT